MKLRYIRLESKDNYDPRFLLVFLTGTSIYVSLQRTSIVDVQSIPRLVQNPEQLFAFRVHLRIELSGIIVVGSLHTT